MSETVRVVLADDHPVIRIGLRDLIDKTDGFSVVGEAGDGEQALNMIAAKRPDIAVLDISMPGLGGLDIVVPAQEACPSLKCVILTMYDEEEYFRQAVGMGVKGYLVKEDAVSSIIDCLRIISDGKMYLSPSVSWQLVEDSADSRQASPSPLDSLTPAERRIMRLIVEGKASKQIANALNISYRTVQNHRANICVKLDLKGANQLLRFVIEHKSQL